MKRVLICPLDWGLGHAARCVPIIKKLIDKGAEVIIAADKGTYTFLEREFAIDHSPQTTKNFSKVSNFGKVRFIRFPSYNITYPKKGSMVVKMLFSIPKIIRGIYREHKLLAQIIKENDIDIVISDNRYGLWNKKIYSVFITHQLMVKGPQSTVHSPQLSVIIEGLLHIIIKWFIKHYDECWIPDFEGEINLSGDLSHKYRLPENTFYIGTLSRFETSSPALSQMAKGEDEKVDLLVILSGPEPQRTILESNINYQLSINNEKLSGLKVVILRGKAEDIEQSTVSSEQSTVDCGLWTPNIVIYSHLETDKLLELIRCADLIICRSGYSSIMDLAAMGKKAVFIPTPGQTEQEYLADYLYRKGMFYYENQNEFNLLRAIKESEKYSGISLENDNALLEQRIDIIMNY